MELSWKRAVVSIIEQKVCLSTLKKYEGSTAVITIKDGGKKLRNQRGNDKDFKGHNNNNNNNNSCMQLI